MENRRVVLIALSFFLFSSASHSQYSNSSEHIDCANSLSAPYAACADQQQTAPNRTSTDMLSADALSATLPSESGSRLPRSLTSPVEENSSLVTASAGIGNQTTKSILPPEPLTDFQKFVAATTGRVLSIYGADLFRSVPATFAPGDLAPADPQYIVGPDDELRVRIWGQINYSGNLRVDRSGNIYLPQVGSVHAAGLPFSALDAHLRAAVGRMYRNFDLSVDLGRIRSMQVYVTGEARRPGVYTISSLSSLVNALFASGGPSPQGSLRHIFLKREGKTITDFDLYAFLVLGDKSHDARLLPEDVLYIPPAGAQVAVLGSVRKPAIYEIKDAQSVGELLDIAGRTTALASNGRISLERVADHQQRTAMEVASDAQGFAVPLADGDIVRVFSILPAYAKTITLRGSVANPGRFSWHQGMRLSDLIPDKESLVSRDYWWKRSHLGLPGEEFEPAISTIGVDARKPESTSRGFTESVSQQTLKTALTADPKRSDEAQTPKGASGTLATQLRQTPATDAAQKVQKNEVRLTAPEINWDYAVIERLDPDTLKTSLIPFDLGKLVLQHDVNQNLVVEPGDTITIFSQEDIRVPLEQQTKYVKLEGEFVHAGVYSVQPGETLRDLVLRATATAAARRICAFREHGCRARHAGSGGQCN